MGVAPPRLRPDGRGWATHGTPNWHTARVVGYNGGATTAFMRALRA
jgi:hypothetical protein